VVGAVLSLMLPATALGATASVEAADEFVAYIAAPGEANVLEAALSSSSGIATFTDLGATIRPALVACR
jgi:hypothetical protein